MAPCSWREWCGRTTKSRCSIRSPFFRADPRGHESRRRGWLGQSPEHKADHGEADEGCDGASVALEVACCVALRGRHCEERNDVLEALEPRPPFLLHRRIAGRRGRIPRRAMPCVRERRRAMPAPPTSLADGTATDTASSNAIARGCRDAAVGCENPGASGRRRFWPYPGSIPFARMNADRSGEARKTIRAWPLAAPFAALPIPAPSTKGRCPNAGTRPRH